MYIVVNPLCEQIGGNQTGELLASKKDDDHRHHHGQSLEETQKEKRLNVKEREREPMVLAWSDCRSEINN